MKILIVCSGNECENGVELQHPFVAEQIQTINKLHKVSYDYFLIHGKGVVGYLRNYFPLIKCIKSGNYDIVHAHYGFSGLLASMQFFTPVIVTFHGSDINIRGNRFFSSLTKYFAKHFIFVSKEMPQKIKIKKNYSVIPCGVDFMNFYPMDKSESRKKLGLHPTRIYILFSSAFSNSIKNYPLAQSAVDLLDIDVELIELVSFSRTEVNLLLNAVDLVLMTSHSEGSPQIIKEAAACNCPIVSVNVGDVREIIGDTEGNFIVPHDAMSLSKAIFEVLRRNRRTNSRNKLSFYASDQVANQVFSIYQRIKSDFT